jgi:hypothetical protein
MWKFAPRRRLPPTGRPNRGSGMLSSSEFSCELDDLRHCHRHQEPAARARGSGSVAGPPPETVLPVKLRSRPVNAVAAAQRDCSRQTASRDGDVV